ncbi:hypothetical protein D0U02_26535 [Burkholderia pseudomallei]|nr:hypothetical protein AQ718_07930 [Burkholderia pseudomallei]OMS27586.1 hypothetical protein AQ739_17495 [Burkholderia pseudomallei]OMS97278.1 hypothetical protein AQ752_04780 [Burkholderia pseudomallei]RFS54837.1 hypothetical protein D0U05_16135 [Burkholderia pseudomallei]RFS56193.1 hypothetical protein D0U02_26535 [Burkholderia pseudomallei]
MKEWKFMRLRAGWAGGAGVRIRFMEAAAARAGGGAAAARREPTLYSARCRCAPDARRSHAGATRRARVTAARGRCRRGAMWREAATWRSRRLR